MLAAASASAVLVASASASSAASVPTVPFVQSFWGAHPDVSVSIVSLFVAILALLVTLIFAWKSHRNQVIAASIAATTGLLKEWRELSRSGAVDTAERLLEEAGPEALRKRGLKAIRRRKDRNTVESVSHLCDEIALRMMWGEANEDELIAFLGAKLSFLWVLYEPLWLHDREHGGDPLHQAGFQAFAERGFRKNATVIEARRIHWFLGRKAHDLKDERCLHFPWFLRSLGMSRGVEEWDQFRKLRRQALIDARCGDQAGCGPSSEGCDPSEVDKCCGES